MVGVAPIRDADALVERFFEAYPMMRPHVGERYRRTTPKLLLVGESHYLPTDSTQHLAGEGWYRGTAASLSAQEREWIDTSGVVRSAAASGFRKKGHVIFKRTFETINAELFDHENAAEVAKDVAFCNFFLRPARTGLSLAVEAADIDIANAALAVHYRQLDPTAIVFLSTFARRHAKPPTGSTVFAVPHPASAWWNRRSRLRGTKTGRELLFDIVSRLTAS